MVNVTLDYSYKYGVYELHFGFSYEDPNKEYRIYCNKYSLVKYDFLFSDTVIKNEKIIMLNNIEKTIEKVIEKLNEYKRYGIDRVSRAIIRKLFEENQNEECDIELYCGIYRIDDVIKILEEIKEIVNNERNSLDEDKNVD